MANKQEKIITTQIDPGIYNLDQLSVQLDVHKTALRELIQTKQLKARKIGKRFFVSRSALEEFVNSEKG
jgi:excisionase family DNA binding protein